MEVGPAAGRLVTLRSLAGGRLFAEVTGAGAPLVLVLHGWGRDRKDLLPAVDGLPGTIASFDLPGFGASPPPPVAWGARDYAEVVSEAIDELRSAPEGGEAPVVLVGHSFGGRVAVCLAGPPAGAPAWIAGLVLTGVPLLRGPTGRPALRFRVVRALHRRGLLSDARMEQVRQRYGSADYRAAQGVMRDTLVRLVAESYGDELARVRCPVRFVWGELDTAAPLATARTAAGLVTAPHEFAVVDGVGHDVHHTRPEVLRREIAALVGPPA